MYIYTVLHFRLSTAIPDGAEFESVSGRRAKAKVCYQEEVISDDDEYLCEYHCMLAHCVQHPYSVHDQKQCVTPHLNWYFMCVIYSL